MGRNDKEGRSSMGGGTQPKGVLGELKQFGEEEGKSQRMGTWPNLMMAERVVERKGRVTAKSKTSVDVIASPQNNLMPPLFP